MSFRPRIMPALVGAMGLLALLKAETLWRVTIGPAPEHRPGAVETPARFGVITPARAAEEPSPSVARVITPVQTPPPDPQAVAERAVLEALRERRTEIDAREAALASREVIIAAAERRMQARIEEMGAMRDRLEALERSRSERDETGWRGLVRLYEGMRPRDAATIFDDLELPVLVQVVDRMAERKAAPVLGAMRPDRARQLTAELARHRSQRNPNN